MQKHGNIVPTMDKTEYMVWKAVREHPVPRERLSRHGYEINKKLHTESMEFAINMCMNLVEKGFFLMTICREWLRTRACKENPRGLIGEIRDVFACCPRYHMCCGREPLHLTDNIINGFDVQHSASRD